MSADKSLIFCLIQTLTYGRIILFLLHIKNGRLPWENTSNLLCAKKNMLGVGIFVTWLWPKVNQGKSRGLKKLVMISSGEVAINEN